MSLDALKSQVSPESMGGSSAGNSAASTPTAAGKALAQQQHVQADAQVPQSAPVTVELANGSPVSTSKPITPAPAITISEEIAVAVDPTIAFIDKTGKMDPPMPPAGYGLAEDNKKRGIDLHHEGDAKRVKRDESLSQSGSQTLDITDTPYFCSIPTSLPFIPGCPHLLFDIVREGETQKEIGNELLERLSDVLGDSAVFQGVRDLCDNQRQRDRETLYRWQDLVGMQMKEGSELFARHIEVEVKHASDPRVLITLKTQHLGQRREFITRCQMSQQQFIEVSAMDRVNALKAQQISLENMKIPEMTVSMDPNVIGMQVGAIRRAKARGFSAFSAFAHPSPSLGRLSTDNLHWCVCIE